VVDPGGDALNASGEAFLSDVLGVRWQHWKGCDDGAVRIAAHSPFTELAPFAFEAGLGDGVHYAAESPDAIEPAGDFEGKTALRYQQTRFGAAVVTPGRSVCFGFPLESVADDEVLTAILSEAIAAMQSPPDEPAN